MIVIFQGLLLAVQTGIVVWHPTPVSIGGLVLVAAMFTFCLVMEAKRR